MKKHIRSKKSQAGFTVIEAMIAIVIGLVVVGAAVALSGDGTRSSRVQGEVTGLGQLFSQVPNLRSNSGYGPNGTNLVPALRQNRAIPAQISDSGTTLSNKWGGPITVTSNGFGYVVTTGGLPPEGCAGVVQRLSGSALATSINGGAAITGEVTSAVATAQCGNASNTLTFTSHN